MSMNAVEEVVGKLGIHQLLGEGYGEGITVMMFGKERTTSNVKRDGRGGTGLGVLLLYSSPWLNCIASADKHRRLPELLRLFSQSTYLLETSMGGPPVDCCQGSPHRLTHKDTTVIIVRLNSVSDSRS